MFWKMLSRAIGAVTLVLVPGVAAAGPSLERGEYLVRGPAACGNCHTPQGPDGPDMSNELGGFMVEKNPAFEAWAVNITPASRVASWSDQELARAIREGIRPDGSVIGPPMPIGLYRGLSDDDLMSIVMFLRKVPASDNVTPFSTYNIPLPPAYGPPVDGVPAVPAGVTVDYGEYLAGPVAHCMECHTTFGDKGPMFDTHLGAGGFEFHGPWGTSVAPNITPHADGIAAYSDEELAEMITKGVRPEGKPMLPPMGYGYYAAMTEDDVKAIILYLRQLPPLADPAG
jgi:hypothetical protein